MTTDPRPRVGGVVLAAGRSARMGEPKALLDVRGRTFVAAAVDALQSGGCDPVVVVGGEPGVLDAARATGAATATSAATGAEQIDSIRIGLDAMAGDVAAAVVLPVDHPLVESGTVAALVDAHGHRPRAVVRPVHDGRPGHPTLFPRPVWSALFDPELARGARSVVESPETETVDVPVDDAGVLADIDTPADYRRYVAGSP